MPDWFTTENIDMLASQYRSLGPLVGILLTFLESFLPFLPLVVIVAVNSVAYGFLWGFILSWAGSTVGAFCVFLLVRRFEKWKPVQKWILKPKVQRLIHTVDLAGITPLLVLLCFPFTPAIVVNIVAGLSNIKRKYYFYTLVLAKLVMIFMLTFVVQDITELFHKPLKLIMVGIILCVLWFGGKLAESVINKRVEKKLRKYNQIK